jgi:SAM-dependent methyltransferase
VRQSLVQEQSSGEHAALAQRTADVERRLAEAERAIADSADHVAALERTLADVRRLQADEAAESRAAHAEFRAAATESRGQLERLAADVATGAADVQATRKRLDAIHPPALPETMAITGEPLAALARERVGLPADVSIETLSTHARYALFETVFYDSRAVAAKQRIYIDYLDRDLALQGPFVDLGCGRGEFLQILRETGIASLGVDINADVLRRLRADGFAVVEQDILAFLESEQRMFSGASMLQVAEHLTPAAIERILALLAKRLLPGALLIIETPNPLSPFALAVFHTDPTHVSPIPPERMRYSIEAAGFERATTLYQARIPADQFAGPDPRAYYADYAIVAYRTADRRLDESGD